MLSRPLCRIRVGKVRSITEKHISTTSHAGLATGEQEHSLNLFLYLCGV
jgi:hypothetical protein